MMRCMYALTMITLFTAMYMGFWLLTMLEKGQLGG